MTFFLHGKGDKNSNVGPREEGGGGGAISLHTPRTGGLQILNPNTLVPPLYNKKYKNAYATFFLNELTMALLLILLFCFLESLSIPSSFSCCFFSILFLAFLSFLLSFPSLPSRFLLLFFFSLLPPGAPGAPPCSPPLSSLERISPSSRRRRPPPPPPFFPLPAGVSSIAYNKRVK